jgi:hypothetical protein
MVATKLWDLIEKGKKWQRAVESLFDFMWFVGRWMVPLWLKVIVFPNGN